MTSIARRVHRDGGNAGINAANERGDVFEAVRMTDQRRLPGACPILETRGDRSRPRVELREGERINRLTVGEKSKCRT